MSPIAVRNAANAQHSTGPVTSEGKARSAQNALRHGLSGRTVVLPHENAADYDSLRASLMAEHQPSGELETQLVAQIADCWWRLQRAHRVETEFLQQRADAISEANPGLDGDAALALMFVDPAQSRSYRLFLRYLTNAQNSYRQACAEFETIRRQRLAREEEQAMLEMMMHERLEARAAAAGTAPPQPRSSDLSSESGFVSHPGAQGVDGAVSSSTPVTFDSLANRR
jgi:hypothetical protein